MTPEWTLGGGKASSLGNIGYGVDSQMTAMMTDNADIFLDPGSVQQLRVSYASGPMSVAAAVEDAGKDDDQALGFAAEAKWSCDSFNAEIAGDWRDGGDDPLDEDYWQVGGGFGFNLADMGVIGVGAAFGESGGTSSEDFWVVSAAALINLGDTTRFEIGAGYKEYDTDEILAVDAGLYYNPVSQLTLGVEAEWASHDHGAPGDEDTLVAAFVTEFGF
jgi:hypothetical protein